MNEFLNRRGLSDSDRCVCGDIETWFHVLFECTEYTEERRVILEGMLAGANIDYDLSWILDTAEKYERMLSFSREVFRKRTLSRNIDSWRGPPVGNDGGR